MYRDQTFALPGEAEGTSWSKIDGMMVWVASGVDIVWGVSENGDLWYRVGVDSNTPMGTNWYKMVTATENLAWSLVESVGTCLWGLQKGADRLICRQNVTMDNIEGGSLNVRNM